MRDILIGGQRRPIHYGVLAVKSIEHELGESIFEILDHQP